MGTFLKLESFQEVQGHSRAVRKFKMFVNQIHQKSEKAKEKIDMENSVSKARKSAGELGSFHIASQSRAPTAARDLKTVPHNLARDRLVEVHEFLITIRLIFNRLFTGP